MRTQGMRGLGALGALSLAALVAGACTRGSSPGAAREPAATSSAPSAASASAGAPSGAAREIVLYDPHAPKSARVTTLAGADKLAPAASKAILDRVFGGKYLGNAAECRPRAAGGLAEARAAGNFAPAVVQSATGAFTAPRAAQTLYVIATGECGATHAESWGSTTLAVVGDGALAATAFTGGGASIETVADVDGDGVDEIVISSGFTNQGTAVASASLAHFEAGKLVTIKDFGQVLDSSCGTGLGGGKESYTVVRVETKPGATPELAMDKKSGACR